MKGAKVLRYLQTVIVLSALSLITVGCASYKTINHEKIDRQIKTAFVMPFEGGGPTESRQQVREAVEAQLVKKGLVITTDYPDVIVEGKITEWSGWFDKKDFWKLQEWLDMDLGLSKKYNVPELSYIRDVVEV